MTQSGGFSGLDEADLELMRAVYAKEARLGNDSPDGSREEGEVSGEEDEGAWSVGVCKGWLAETVACWLELPGELHIHCVLKVF
jgi:hypothetical protein